MLLHHFIASCKAARQRHPRHDINVLAKKSASSLPHTLLCLPPQSFRIKCLCLGMGLVEYSDSSADSEAEAPLPPKKRQRTENNPIKETLPALPTAFHDLYASSIRVSVRDDPNLHGGRKRVIPHVEGNWPTHIYLEWYPRRDELAVLADVLSKCEAESNHGTSKICSLLYSELGVQLPLHVSLSRPVVLSTDQKQPFIEAFEHAIKASNTKPFTVVPDTLDWVSNTERTRWFLVIRLEKPKDDNLNRLLRISNRILDSYGQPPLYATEIGATNRLLKHDKTKPPVAEVDDYTNCFHISLAWSLTEPSLEEQQRVSSIALDEMASLEINFSSVKAKIGNVIQCCLKVQAHETHGPTLASVANTTAFNLKITLKSVFHNWDVLRQHGQSSGTECHTGRPPEIPGQPLLRHNYISCRPCAIRPSRK
uniref:U6 snRNA phosphodiesterase n=1 Tax=Talaromyces marneffei PM1 TaxID=1077442 RepID=A0A093VED3_TALMA